MSNRVGSLYYEVLLNDKTSKGRKKIASGARELTAFLKKQREERVSDIDKLHAQHKRLIDAAGLMFKEDAETRKAVEAGITQNLIEQIQKRDAARRADYAKQKQQVDDAHAYALKMLKEENIARFNAEQAKRNMVHEANWARRKANDRAKKMFSEGIANMARERDAKKKAESDKKKAVREANEAIARSQQKGHEKEMRQQQKVRDAWNNLDRQQKKKTEDKKRREAELARYLDKVKRKSLQMEKMSQKERERLIKEEEKAKWKQARDEDRRRFEKAKKERIANAKAKARFKASLDKLKAIREAASAKERSTIAYLARVRINSAKLEAQIIEEQYRQHLARMEEIRRQEGINSMFGKGGMLSRATAWIGTMTMKLFPLYAAWMAVSRVLGMVKRGFAAVIDAIDTKKLQMLRLAALNQGDVEVAKKLRKELVEYARATAFSVEETMQLAVRVRALGVASEDVVDVIKVFGRLSLGNSLQFQRIVKAYTDVVSKGKLMTVEIKQFAENGVNIRKALRELLDIDDAELSKRIEKGVVSAQTVEKALRNLYEEYGPLEFATLDTVSGQLSVMAEGFKEFLAEIGKTDWIVDVMKDINKVLDFLYAMTIALSKVPEYWDASEVAARAYFATLTFGISEFLIVGSQLSKAGLDGILGRVGLGDVDRLRDVVMKLITFRNSGSATGLDDFGEESASAAMARVDAATQEYKMNLKILELAKERHAAELEAARGGDTKLRQLEARLALEKSFKDSMSSTADSGMPSAMRERLASENMKEEYKFMLDTALIKQGEIEAKKAKHTADRLERALSTSMPGKMRQNSVEEWVYLKSKRDEADRERRAEKRWQDGQKAEEERAQLIVDGITEGFKQAIDNMNTDSGSSITISGV